VIVKVKIIQKDFTCVGAGMVVEAPVTDAVAFLAYACVSDWTRASSAIIRDVSPCKLSTSPAAKLTPDLLDGCCVSSDVMQSVVCMMNARECEC
jgi:hypothetical protein